MDSLCNVDGMETDLPMSRWEAGPGDQLQTIGCCSLFYGRRNAGENKLSPTGTGQDRDQAEHLVVSIQGKRTWMGHQVSGQKNLCP